ncbi:DeoR/GlpR transcriptional regulator [Streptomyces oryzae]|uniref:Lactose phosphotransferase system repressor n=1 Tax=Streptomyces oryzae TaxID=1434886 RepID=A0ABS3XAA6_9ACTN|nr:DeoR/GlpR family DNA-binding transcription regulator [Streptomyces oryzae]MBO8192293.1 DeoR/GlpR transcriptional regulator [Streptomyces oryzae]
MDEGQRTVRPETAADAAAHEPAPGTGAGPASDAASGQENAAMRYTRAAGRRAHILERVQASGFVSVADLVADLGVSDMTIRRDLRRLSADGDVRVVRGGISLPHATLRTSEFISRAHSSAEAKKRIAARAAELVHEDDVVAVDAGTTTFGVVAHFPPAFTGTVVTHSVPVIQQLLHLPGARVVGLGGELYPPSQAFVGATTVEQAQRLRMRLFFLGAAAVDERGVYVEADVERATKLALMEPADEVVLLVDAAKFSSTAPVRLCGLDRLTSLVTDERPPARVARELERHGVHVTTAD